MGSSACGQLMIALYIKFGSFVCDLEDGWVFRSEPFGLVNCAKELEGLTNPLNEVATLARTLRLTASRIDLKSIVVD